MNTVITIVFSTLIVLGKCAIPDYIHVCHHDDPDLAGCITKSIDILRPRIEVGIPELEIPSIEPFTLDIVSFKTTESEASHLKTNVTNIEVFGASNFKILKLTPKLTKNGNKFRFEVIIPKLYIKGDYQVDSKLLLLQIRGNGPFQANITNFHFECELRGQKVQREGENHLEFEDMKCNAVIEKISILLKNLFSGNPILEQATNAAINDNSIAFFEEIRPSIIDMKNCFHKHS